MDNFMDKLAKRFNAGEMIKANAQAEAREMRIMQERAAEYERMMQEMRRLNLKNVELTEQVQQLIRCGIEQFEGYNSGEEILGNKIAHAAVMMKESSESVKDEIESIVNDNMRQGQMELQNALRILGERISAGNEIEEAFERLETIVSTGKFSTEEKLRDVSGLIMRADDNIREISGLIGRTDENVREISGLIGHTDESVREISGLIGHTNENVREISGLIGHTDENMREAAEAITQMETSITSLREILVATRISVEEGQKRLEKHVHEEDIRVYRNVQAFVIDELTKRARDMGTRLDQLESNVKKNSGMKPLLILTLLLALASVGLQVAQILQLL